CWRGRLGIGLGRAGARRRRGFLADRLTVVVADHHDDEVRFLGGDELARHLRPFDIAPLIVADQAGIGAMLADDPDLRFFREGIFKPVGQPVGVAVAYHHDGGGGFGLLLRGWRRARIVDGRLAFLLAVGIVIAPVIPPATAPAAPVVVVVLLLALRTIAPIPELRLRRQQQRKRDTR